MSDLAVITPSYGEDAEPFAELHRSVLEYTTDDTVHHVIVPPADRDLFVGHQGPRCRVWTYPELLPRHYRGVPGTSLWANVRRPWPPVRGWVLQQTLKIAVAGTADATAALIVDSDVALVRPVTSRLFAVEGGLRLHRVDGAVHAGMERHVRWHAVARELLGLPPSGGPPLHDYMSSPNCWDPQVVRAMQRRIRETTGRDWLDAFNSRLHISECILYGVFVDEVLGGAPATSSVPICHNWWDRTPMDHEAAVTFAGELPPEAVAVMINAKSGTPREVRQEAIRRCARVAEGHA